MVKEIVNIRQNRLKFKKKNELKIILLHNFNIEFFLEILIKIMPNHKAI